MTLFSELDRAQIEAEHRKAMAELAEEGERIARHLALTTRLSYEQAKEVMRRLVEHQEHLMIVGVGIHNSFRCTVETVRGMARKLETVQVPDFTVAPRRSGRRPPNKPTNLKPFWVQKWEKNARKRR